MKNTIFLFPLCLALACGWAGCSKAKNHDVLAKPQTAQAARAAAPDDPIAIRLKWIPGDRYVILTETVIGGDAVIPDSADPKEFALALGQECSISPGKPLADGGQELDAKITGQRFFCQIAERNFLICDSRQSAAEDAADPVSPQLRKLVGAPVKLFTDADGKLARSVGVEALTTNWNLGNAQVKTMLQDVFTGQNLRLVFDLGAAAQPGDAMKVGQSWAIHLEL